MKKKSSIIPISSYRFNSLTFSKHPLSQVVGTEIEYYSDSDERVLGVLILDNFDKDWNYIILGRDERSIFRCIDVGVSHEKIDEARRSLHFTLQQHSESGKVVFEQSDVKEKKNEIFKEAKKGIKYHKNFEILRDDIGHSSAKGIIKELAYAFVDLDGNFNEQFQSEGFNSRLWELYLYAYLHEELFVIDENYSYPDYCVSKWIGPIFIECTTVNKNPNFDIPFEPTDQREIDELNRDYIPIKFGSSLYSKLKRKYWLEDHVKGNSLIFAVHDFHMESSMTWTSSGLTRYLFGIEFSYYYDSNNQLKITTKSVASHTYKGKTIPSGFFNQPDSENVSAVLFSNSATLSKFNRIGKLAGYGNSEVKFVRMGICHDHNPNASSPKRFSFDVETGSYDELWGEGLAMFHNPNALHPVDINLFPSIAHHQLKDGNIVSYLPDFHPYSSITSILIPQK